MGVAEKLSMALPAMAHAGIAAVVLVYTMHQVFPFISDFAAKNLWPTPDSLGSRFYTHMLALMAISPNVWTLQVKAHLAGAMGYWYMSILTTALDLFPSTTIAWKVQGAKSYFTFKEWLDAVVVSNLNLWLTATLINIPLASFYTWRGGLAEGEPWIWHAELLKFVGCAVVVDVWFYWTHRLIHHPALYGPIHKFHHRFKAPTAVASMYANPLEFALGNLLGVVLGPILTCAHPFTTCFWVCFALITTGGAHSGYWFFDAEGHDQHHEFFNYNFGVGGIMDKMFATEFEGSKLWEKQQKKKADGKKIE